MGSSGGGGGGSGDSTNTVRYASYIESKHQTFLNVSEAAGDTARSNNPFDGYTDLDFSAGFYGAGYALASFPSLYDMYGKFIAGLDVEALWVQILDSTQDNSAVSELVSAEAALLDERVEQTTLPRFKAGQRDINSVISSSFLVGQSVIETGLNHDVAKFSSSLRYKLIPVAAERWRTHLEWNKDVIRIYSTILQLVINTELATDDRNFDNAVKNELWPFTVLDFERANLGALQGAISGKSGAAGGSKSQRAIGGGFSGAAVGGQVGGPWGALIGGVLGVGASFLDGD